MIPLNPISKPYGNDPIPFSEAESFWPSRTSLYSHNPKTSMPSLKPPTIMTFPVQLSPPTSLQFRPLPLGPAFAALDADYEKCPHPILASQGMGCGGYNENEDESRNKDALKTLEKHIKDRTPYIKLASARLQAVCGVRNERPFDLPELPKRNLSPKMQTLYDLPMTSLASSPSSTTDNGGVKSKAAARFLGGSVRIDSEIASMPRSPIGPVVDKETGKGLREFLLQKGKECGMRKRECKSITFHDFTPDMRTGNHNNILLGHYCVGKGERIDVYEVDLPTTQLDDDTGDEFPATETWIWILISRPLVSYDSNDLSTQVPENVTNLASPSSDVFFTPYSTRHSPQLATIHSTPPNFPYPIPLSWLVFAAPKAHITTYPEAIENLEGPPSTHSLASASKTLEKRVDYDFSFCGIPLFEFSSAELFSHASKRTEFLSVEGMGGWCENDQFQDYIKEEYVRMYSLCEDGEWHSRSGTTGSDEGFDEDGKPRASIPAPNKGVWWKVFYQRMYEDCDRWDKVRKAMGRGKCRVVVRWNERAGQALMEMGAGRVLDGKQIGGKNGTQGKRLTRSETRRRSGLGLSDPSAGALIAGTNALGGSAKSRAAGNLARGAGALSNNEKKGRK